MKKKLIIACICIFALAICIVPFPKRVCVEAEGSKLSPAGESLADITVTADGWLLNYLFRKDILKVTVAIKETHTGNITTTETIGPIYRYDNGLQQVTISGFDSEGNRISFRNFWYTQGYQALLVTDASDNIYVASADGQVSVEILWDTYGPFVK